jgi:hypothetical protein
MARDGTYSIVSAQPAPDLSLLKHIRNEIERGKLRIVRSGHRKLVRRGDLEAYLARDVR